MSLPYGAATYSKGWPAFGRDAPLYVSHGDGWRIFDTQGRDYCDMIMGLGAVILGHRHPDVDEAIRRQLANGTTLSLATPLELEAAERVLAHFPAGCMLQWGTNGTDATTGACRLARLITSRDYIVMASDGYHGFADWSLAKTQRGNGIPFGWGVTRITSTDMSHIEGSEVAAVILEPDLHPTWLKPLREWCSVNGALLIADELNCWQRWPEWTATAHYGITPDLWCLGKTMANGMPVSAIVGPRDIVGRFAPGELPNAFFSSTWAGHPLSMAAVVATLDVMEQEDGPARLFRQSRTLHSQIRLLSSHCSIGEPPFNRVTFRSKALERVWRRAMNEAGTLIYLAQNLSLAHDDNAMARLLNSWGEAAEVVDDWVDSHSASAEEEPPAGVMRR